MNSSILTTTFAVVMLLGGCATPSAMSTGPTVIGAEGEVKVADGPNGNTKVKVVIHHLAAAEKVASGATVYVVWIQPTGGGASQNVGQITLDADRVGVLETLTPFKAFTVTVTPEPLATALAPSSNPVLSTQISAPQ